MSDNTFMAKAEKVWSSVRKYFKVKKLVFGLRYGKFKKKVHDYLKSKDAKMLKRFVFDVLMDGLFLSALLYPFVGFRYANIFIFGGGWFFLKTQGLSQLRSILASINLVKIGK